MQVPPILEDHLCFRNSWSSVILGHFLWMAIKAFLLTHGISPSFVCPTIVNKASCTPDSNNWRSTSKGMAKFGEPTAKYDFALALYDDLPVLFPVYIYIFTIYNGFIGKTTLVGLTHVLLLKSTSRGSIHRLFQKIQARKCKQAQDEPGILRLRRMAGDRPMLDFPSKKSGNVPHENEYI